MKSTMKSSMKIKVCHGWAIVCVICAAVSIAAAMDEAPTQSYAPYPQPDGGYVTDLGNLLSDAQETQLEGWLYDCEKEKGVEVAVVTIGSISDYPGTDNGSIEAFATGLFGRYGIGNMPNNNGIMLLVSVNDREAKIELGDGYESARDADAERIMQSVIVPQFRNGRYDRGILEGAKSILRTFAGKEVTAAQAAPVPQTDVPVQEAQTTRNAVPSGNSVPRQMPQPIQNFRPGRKAVGLGGFGCIAGLLLLGLPLIVLLIIVSAVSRRGGTSGGYPGNNTGLQNNSVIGPDGSGIVPDDGFGRGFWTGLFAGGLGSGHRGMHNGGIHFGGTTSHRHGTHFGGMSSSHNRGIGHGGISSRSHGTGFRSRHSAGGFGGGFGGGHSHGSFGGGHSGGSHRSGFGGGFSRGGGAKGKW